MKEAEVMRRVSIVGRWKSAYVCSTSSVMTCSFLVGFEIFCVSERGSGDFFQCFFLNGSVASENGKHSNRNIPFT